MLVGGVRCTIVERSEDVYSVIGACCLCRPLRCGAVSVGAISGRTYMDVVQDLFAVLAAAGFQFPYLGVVLIGTGVVLVCIGAIFWRRASRSGAIGQPPEDAAGDAPEGNPQGK